jgi:hypothetical protein
MKSVRFVGWAVLLPAIAFGSGAATAQELTIPQILSQGVTEKVGSAGFSAADGFPEAAGAADVVVTGVVGNQVAALSADQVDVYTDYELTNVSVLYQSAPSTSPLSGSLAKLTVSQLGGQILIGGTEFVHTVNGLARLEPGATYLLMLQRIRGRLVVGEGGFKVSNNRLVPIVEGAAFAAAYRTMPAADAVSAIARRVQAVGKSR